MQREFQKQMGNLISIPVAKEVKSMEVTLGQRMEKLLTAQVDEIMVHLQEDNAKREIMERERTEQMTTMLSNIFNKDMPAAFERSAKKELASIGSTIARLVTPSIEKAISSAVSETFQVCNRVSLFGNFHHIPYIVYGCRLVFFNGKCGWYKGRTALSYAYV